MNDYRTIHLWEFPEDKIFVQLEDSYRKQLFGELLDKFGNTWQLSRALCLGYTTTKHMIDGVRYRNEDKLNEQVHCRLKLLKKIAWIHSELYGEKQCAIKSEIEKNVSSYHALSGTQITEPKLPIVARPELFRAIGHVIADGTWTPRSSARYINSSIELIERFKEDLNLVFGNVETNYINKGSHTPYLIFPTAIVHVLMDKYNVKFSGVNGFPNIMNRIPNRHKSYFLQALFDDEGFVHDSNIQICGLDRGLLEGVKRILYDDFHINTGDIAYYQDYHRTKQHGTISKVAYFHVLSEGIPRYASHIGFQHPKKKDRLNLLLAIRKRGMRNFLSHEEVKERVIAELKNGPKTAPELAVKLILTARNLRDHLYVLEKKNEIRRLGKRLGKGGPQLWSLNP
ncbi:Uncharacterised protein [uncultured archaeon]|nr:Uncharacterised protein [uncultured archaeon]